MRPSLRQRPARVERGFTLVELMTVVAITGILAAICAMLVFKHMRAARTVDAVAGMQAIRAAEESFKAENGRYLDCSRAAGPAWYPMTNPGQVEYSWVQPAHLDWKWWKQLGINRERTRFGYLVNAGLPTEKFTTSQLTTYTFPNTALTEPWFVVQMKGDRDGDGVPARGLIHSFNGETFLQDDDE